MTTCSVLFVCTGNTCRSPMAEYLMRHRSTGLLTITCTSAGVFAQDGAPASPHSIQAMQELGIDITGHTAQSLTSEIIDEAGMIVVMTSAHRETLCRLFPGAEKKTHLLHTFGTEAGARDVTDPYGLSIAAYRKTRDDIDSAISDLIIFLKEAELPSEGTERI